MQQLKTEKCIICGQKAKYWGGHVKGLYKYALGYSERKVIAGFCENHKEHEKVMRMVVMESMIPVRWENAYRYLIDKVVTHVTKKFFIIIIEIKPQSKTFKANSPCKRHRSIQRCLFE